MKNLIWKFNKEKEIGYWECKFCGAIYYRPENWEPPTTWCMKCRREWI